MKWTHIDYSIEKAKKKLGLLRRQSQNLTLKQKIYVFNTMIRPILEYGSVLFDNCSTIDDLKLESCQRTAALICTGAVRRTETKLLLEHLGWESLTHRRYIAKLSLFYKIMHNQAPPYLLRNITFNQTQAHSLRKSHNLKFPRCKLELYKKSFFPSCIAIWNNLPDRIKKNATNLSAFERELKNQANVGIDELKKNNPLYHSHEGFFGKILTQIKLKLSPLRSQLFNYNLTDNPFCPTCNDSIETPLHFFLNVTPIMHIVK